MYASISAVAIVNCLANVFFFADSVVRSIWQLRSYWLTCAIYFMLDNSPRPFGETSGTF